jgi:predicted GNAT family N-acyltransferase
MLAGVGGEIELRWARGSEDVDAALRIREQVFCVEQGVPREEELDELDEQALHLLAFDGERAVGTLRLVLLGGDAKIGRVAVEADRRHRGIASRMLALALTRARHEGARCVRLAAQIVAVALYEQAGFAVEPGGPFDDAGIPHVWMSQRLTSA